MTSDMKSVNVSKENNAQRSSSDKRFKDEKSSKEKVRNNSGGYNEVTYYSDGSSTTHFGGPVGDVNYDKYGREC